MTTIRRRQSRAHSSLASLRRRGSATPAHHIGSQEATDNDDGSAYYDTHHNFFPFSEGGLKGDFGGHDNSHHHNLYSSMASMATI